MHSQGKAEREAINRRLAENLRRIRQDRGLSQEALADLPGWSPCTECSVAQPPREQRRLDVPSFDRKRAPASPAHLTSRARAHARCPRAHARCPAESSLIDRQTDTARGADRLRARENRDLWRFQVEVDGIADLRSESQLARVGLATPMSRRHGWPAFQKVGEQLRAEGWSGVRAVSAARPVAQTPLTEHKANPCSADRESSISLVRRAGC